ncbi:MAG: TfoX/Sxy family protein [Alphaproteobacteria bacterium]|nr:TfoX/Sxy family protein [Alphaproteobacteria bacterium]
MSYDEATAARVRRILAKRRDVVAKPMMGGLCFMVSRGMCCSVSGRGGLLVRVDHAERDKLVTKPHVQPAEMRGRIMSGFVRVAAEGYRSDAALRAWIERGIAAAARRAALSPRKPKRATPVRRRKRPAGI